MSSLINSDLSWKTNYIGQQLDDLIQPKGKAGQRFIRALTTGLHSALGVQIFEDIEYYARPENFHDPERHTQYGAQPAAEDLQMA